MIVRLDVYHAYSLTYLRPTLFKIYLSILNLNTYVTLKLYINILDQIELDISSIITLYNKFILFSFAWFVVLVASFMLSRNLSCFYTLNQNGSHSTTYGRTSG